MLLLAATSPMAAPAAALILMVTSPVARSRVPERGWKSSSMHVPESTVMSLEAAFAAMNAGVCRSRGRYTPRRRTSG